TIVTELATFDITPDGLLMTAMSPDTTADKIAALTGVPFKTASPLQTYAG
ncbi:MAG: succinyl-CoA--3-ketoacid-CoA transferase, partial [Elusimicrobia bacterium]|nr:succinyl-CoA--3-ketoacid-CoA transferase [Elusimicrobiota bacterium]